MSRWTIEKDGTGIEKSGTGVEKSGTGIERSGTGIEKSGTGIEKSGTGIQRFAIACVIVLISFAGNLQAGNLSPSGSLQLVVDRDTIAVSWIFDGSVFSGIGSINGSFTNIQLTEISLRQVNSGFAVTGTGSGKEVTGTGSGKEVTGTGSGSSTLVTGSGSGLSVQVTGSGSGSSILVTGSGSGQSTEVTGSGSGSSRTILVPQAGSESIAITLPTGSGLGMEISLSCRSANVTVLDADLTPVAMFNNVNVVGDTGLCGGTSGARFTQPGFDFISN